MNAFRPAGVICLLLCAAAPLQAQTAPGPIPEQGHPAKLPGALQYDFTSRITGRPYRLTITPPVNPNPSLLYPALYVLDGSAWFATSSEVATVFGATGQTGTGYVIAFYESDCLGRSPVSLIAGRSGPEQSAPTACGTRPRGWSGSAGQSASASFSSLELPIHLDDCQHDGRAHANHGS